MEEHIFENQIQTLRTFEKRGKRKNNRINAWKKRVGSSIPPLLALFHFLHWKPSRENKFAYLFSSGLCVELIILIPFFTRETYHKRYNSNKTMFD